MGYYNYHLTGDVLLSPYAVNNRAYASVPIFWVLPPVRLPAYRHEMIRKLWVEWYAPYFYKTRTNPLRVVLGNTGLIELSRFYFSTQIAFAFLCGVLLSRSRKVRLALLILAVFCCGLCLQIMLFPHYAAPALGILLVPAMQGLRVLRVKTGNAGPAFVLIFVAASLGAGLVKLYEVPRDPSSRQRVEEKLISRGGRHLVIVRYSPKHDPHQEFVFNRADIDGSAIVWARDMGDVANRELIDYYASRQIWLLAPDEDATSLLPYRPGTH